MTTCRERLEGYLREQRVAYEVQHHPLAFTARGVAASEHIGAGDVAKTVMVMADGRQVMLVLAASHDVNLDKLAQALGVSAARLADEPEFGPLFSDCELGAMPAFGNLYGVDVYVDRGLADHERIVCQAGTHTDTLHMTYADFARLVKPTVVDAAKPHFRSSVLT